MHISDNEIYFLIKHIKSVLWKVANRLSYIDDARCLKVNATIDLSAVPWRSVVDEKVLRHILSF